MMRATAPVVPMPTPTRLSMPGQRNRIGIVSIGQIVVAQLAILAAAAAYPTPDWIFLPVLLLSLLVVLAVFARRGKRWWHADVLQRLRFRWRHRGAVSADRLGAIAPQLAVRDVTDRGTRVGIGIDSAGWYAALLVTPGSRIDDVPDLDGMIRTLSQVSAPVSALQLVHHTVPVPSVVCAAGEWTWVALRISGGDATWEADSRGGGVDGVHRTVAAAVGRVGKTLRAAGTDSRVLTGSELVDALATVGGWSNDDSTSGRTAPERWDAWPGADAEHVSFRMAGKFSLTGLVDGLHATSVQSATVTVRFAPAAVPAIHGILRVGVNADQAQSTIDEVFTVADQVGALLHRLDGAHTPAIYAAAPTAWALR